MAETAADFPAKLQFLFAPHRYKVAYGGRGGAKSWGFARALLILGAQSPLRILCARETQKSIADSVHKLLADQVKALGLEEFYLVQQASIQGANGTEFIFAGIRQSSVGDIKSYEGCDICWVEEAQIVSKHSWDVLIPTIRKDDSEIWVSLNPELESDETYKRFILNPPKSAKVVEINWRDNPWFPPVLDEERRSLQELDLDSYQYVWEGKCRHMGDGAYFSKIWDRVVRQGEFGPIKEPYAGISEQQYTAVVKPWWKLWMSGDWGWGHHTAYYWHCRGVIEPQDAAGLGLRLRAPISAVITYREFIGQGLAERDIADTLIQMSTEQERGLARYSAMTGAPEKIKVFYFSPDAFELSIRRSGQNTIADEIGKALRVGGLPYPAKANNARISGARAMYGLLTSTKAAFEGLPSDGLWLITDRCPELLRSIPRAQKDPKNLEDILKTDKAEDDVAMDSIEAARYGILCREVSDRPEPQEAKDAEVIAKCPDINSAYLMRGWLQQNRAKKPDGIAGW
jgi:hypothetical protein